MQSEKKEFGGWWIWILTLLVITMIIMAALNITGVIGKTIVERVVFEQSFQYREGMKQRVNTLEANIVEIDSMIALGQGDADELQAQKRVLKIQLNSMIK